MIIEIKDRKEMTLFDIMETYPDEYILAVSTVRGFATERDKKIPLFRCKDASPLYIKSNELDKIDELENPSDEAIQYSPYSVIQGYNLYPTMGGFM